MQIYITFGLYLLVILGIGLYAYRSTQNFDDYILGGRKMGSFVTAMSAGASDMSGWLLMGLPGAIFLSGLSEAWIAVGLTIGAFMNYKIVAGRLRIFTEKYSNALTLPEFFAQRFPRQKKALQHRALVRRNCNHRLHLYRWLFSGFLERYHSSLFNDFCLNPCARNGIGEHRLGRNQQRISSKIGCHRHSIQQLVA